MKHVAALLFACLSAPAFSLPIASFRGDAQHSGIYLDDWPMFSSPAIAGRNLYIGSNSGTLMAIDLDTHATNWTFSTDGAKRNAAALTLKNGDPNYAAAFTDSFYDDLVIGVWKMLSIGAVLSSPVVEQDMIYFGSTDGNLYAIS